MTFNIYVKAIYEIFIYFCGIKPNQTFFFMKQIKITLLLVAVVVVFSGCATIIGGANYNAHVVVNGSSKAEILHDGIYKGTGIATFPVKRTEANKLVIQVKEEGYKEQIFRYNARSFRWWAFAGTVLGWTGLTVNGVYLPIPFGVIVDFSAGALWKPDIMEPGVSKLDYKNFQYILNYDKMPNNPPVAIPPVNPQPQNRPETTITEGSSLIDVVYLTNGDIVRGIIIEQRPNDYIKIRSNYEIYVFRMTDIEKIMKEAIK